MSRKRKSKRPARPTTLPIGAVPFRVTFAVDEMPKDSKKDFGETKYPDCILHINEDMCATVDDGEARTLLHEGVHGAIGVSGLEEAFDAAGKHLNFDLEEAVCTAIESNLYPFIRALVKLGYFR